MTPDEQAVYDERLAILIEGTRPPTVDEVAMANEDTERFRRESAEQKELL